MPGEMQRRGLHGAARIDIAGIWLSYGTASYGTVQSIFHVHNCPSPAFPFLPFMDLHLRQPGQFAIFIASQMSFIFCICTLLSPFIFQYPFPLTKI